MRREPFTIGSYVHVVKRGARGLSIFKNENDFWRGLLMLCHFNDEFHSDNWFRDLMDEKIANTLERSKNWPRKTPLVSILAFTFLDNHFHLLLKEIKNGGIATFMNKIGKGMTQSFNLKYPNNRGSIFQGPYQSRTISTDSYFKCVAMYIMIKNGFEMHPRGYDYAVDNFEKAYDWAKMYPFSSLMDYSGNQDFRQIIDKDLLGEIFPTELSLKSFASDYIHGRGVDDNLITETSFE